MTNSIRRSKRCCSGLQMPRPPDFSLTTPEGVTIITHIKAGVAQLVEYKLPKLGVAGSKPVARSIIPIEIRGVMPRIFCLSGSGQGPSTASMSFFSRAGWRMGGSSPGCHAQAPKKSRPVTRPVSCDQMLDCLGCSGFGRGRSERRCVQRDDTTSPCFAPSDNLAIFCGLIVRQS
jgi:hypothetical protein